MVTPERSRGYYWKDMWSSGGAVHVLLLALGLGYIDVGFTITFFLSFFNRRIIALQRVDFCHTTM